MVQYTIWQVEFTIEQIILQQEQISDKKECFQKYLSVSQPSLAYECSCQYNFKACKSLILCTGAVVTYNTIISPHPSSLCQTEASTFELTVQGPYFPHMTNITVILRRTEQ